MALKVALINAPVLAVLEPWYDTPDFGRTGLAYLAGYLRKFDGFDIRIIDAKFERLDFTQVLEKLEAWRPDVVGFTAYTNEIKPAAYLAAHVKKRLPQATTVIGGVHLTAIPNETMAEFPMFDVGVVGEGEITFHELCAALQENRPLTDIDGLVHRLQGEIILNAPRKRNIDLDDFPMPAWDLLPPAKTYFLQRMRGCPFNCSFCMNPNGRLARTRSVENVIAEIRWLQEDFGAQYVSFGDEIFSVDMPATHALMDALIETGLGANMRWDVQTHVRYVDEALFRKMKAANVDQVELGIETGDVGILKDMGKGTSLKMIVAAFEAARRAGVKTGAFFLFGQPNETPESLRKTIDLAVKINPGLPMFGLMVPYPATRVAALAAEGKGGYRLLTTDWDAYNKQIGGALEFAGLDRRAIESLQLRAYLRIFLANFRFLDLLRTAWTYRTAAFSILKKIFGRKTMPDMLHKPPDYDAILAAGTPAPTANMVHARSEWNALQKSELVRSKKEKPELFT